MGKIIFNTAMRNCLFFFVLSFLSAVSFGLQGQVSAGNGCSGYLSDNGTVFTWGRNVLYQLGRETAADFDPKPEAVSGLPQITQFDAGNGATMVALACDGSVWTWGEASKGQLGNGKRIGSDALPCASGKGPGNCDSYIPVPVKGGEMGTEFLEGVVAVSAGFVNVYAISQDSSLYGWGESTGGKLGLGAEVDSLFFEPVRLPLNNVIAVDATQNGCYVLVDPDGDGVGSVYGFGEDSGNDLKFGPNWETGVPQLLFTADGEPLDNIVAIAAGGSHGLFLDKDGFVWAIGAQWAFSQLGVAEIPYSGIKKGFAYRVLAGGQAQVEGYGDERYLMQVKEIAAGESHSLAIAEYDTDTVVWGWGSNRKGQLGESGTSVAVPKLVNLLPDSLKYAAKGISAGSSTTFVTFAYADGKSVQIYAGGENNEGELGDGTTDETGLPVEIDILRFKNADNCPSANFGLDTVKVCKGELSLQDGAFVSISPGEGLNCTYKWELRLENGSLIKNDVLMRYTGSSSGAYLNAYWPGTYKVSVEKEQLGFPGSTCNTCEPVEDSVVVAYRHPGFGVRTTYMNEQFLNVELEGFAGQRYGLYADQFGGALLSGSISDGRSLWLTAERRMLKRVLVDEYGDNYPADVEVYKVWVDDFDDEDSICARYPIIVKSLNVHIPLKVISQGAASTDAYSNDGSIELVVVGGESPYGFKWSNGSDADGLANINSGEYSVTVFDSAGDSVVKEINLATSGFAKYSVKGQVLYENTACGGCPVWLYRDTLGGFMPVAQTETSAEGRYVFESIMKGTYVLMGIPPAHNTRRFVPTYAIDKRRLEDAYQLNIQKDVFHFNMKLQKSSGWASGECAVVVDLLSFRPEQDDEVLALLMKDREIQDWGYIEADGTVNFQNLAEGQYTVVLQNAGSPLFEVPVTLGGDRQTVWLSAELTRTGFVSSLHSDYLDAFRLYPQPVHDAFRVEGIENGTMELLDIYGTIRLKTEVASAPVSVAHLPAGTYVLKVYCSDGAKALKLIKY